MTGPFSPTCGGLVGLADEGDSPGDPISRINNRETVLQKVCLTPLLFGWNRSVGVFNELLQEGAKDPALAEVATAPGQK
jgi:hypothetical protein